MVLRLLYYELIFLAKFKVKIFTKTDINQPHHRTSLAMLSNCLKWVICHRLVLIDLNCWCTYCLDPRAAVECRSVILLELEKEHIRPEALDKTPSAPTGVEPRSRIDCLGVIGHLTKSTEFIASNLMQPSYQATLWLLAELRIFDGFVKTRVYCIINTLEQ